MLCKVVAFCPLDNFQNIINLENLFLDSEICFLSKHSVVVSVFEPTCAGATAYLGIFDGSRVGEVTGVIASID